MSIPVVAFFNNKGGVGKTSMVYHLAWMFADHDIGVVAADLDPQANLTAWFLDDERLEEIVLRDGHPKTIFGAVQPLKRGTGDIKAPHVEEISDYLGVVPGDMALSTFEDQLSEVWPKCLDRDERSFRVMSAFWRVVQQAADTRNAAIILVDLGPNLGAINRAALISSDFVVIPLGPDLFSIQGLRNLGPALHQWRREWQERVERNPVADLRLPAGRIEPLGYVVLRHSIRLDRPVKAFERWIATIPGTYREVVLDVRPTDEIQPANDPHCIARLKDYRALMPLAQEARKPMFLLKAADGALGAHTYAVTDAYHDFKEMAKKIAAGAGIGEMS
ncbi:MAG: ParA family protein [Desulfofustis sp. PB-SRB1]|jgi:chromosome partitioning protein|nr:ParA family protein [Desulfofustis sp. PB-SRB1]MBM1002865.1 ParA family protein [Desulfofustis sp. PB-SRB1]HBH28488.1 ParA family protein [Desulfofustis sp.]